MAKIINRNVPIAEENETLSGEPATNMFNDWSEGMTDRADDIYHQPEIQEDKEERKRRLREMDEIVKNEINKTGV